MKILHTSDWHVGKTLRGRSRAEEHRRVLAEIVDVAATNKVDLVLVAGDLFDTAAPSPEAEQIVYKTLLDLVDTGARVAVIAGNHDNARRLHAVEPLLDLGNVIVAPFVRRCEDGGAVTVSVRSGEEARIALLPFVSQRYVVRADDLISKDRRQHDDAYAERIARIIAHLAAPASAEAVQLLMAHLTVAGGRIGGGERPAHTVIEYAVPARVFAPHLDYVALGHLHRQQEVPAEPTVWYSGSPLQFDFGEIDEAKGVLLVNTTAGKKTEVRPLPLSGGRRLVKVQGTLEELESLAADPPDAHLRIVVEETARAGLNEEVRRLFPEAIDVVVALPGDGKDAGPEPEPRLGRPPRQLFTDYLIQRDVIDERLLALFDELMEEVHEAGTP
jgi:exonuclease SbcD